MELENLKRESDLIDRTIWCNLHKTLQPLIKCKGCGKRDNCEYRDYGAMRIVNVNFDNWFNRESKEGG